MKASDDIDTSSFYKQNTGRLEQQYMYGTENKHVMMNAQALHLTRQRPEIGLNTADKV